MTGGLAVFIFTYLVVTVTSPCVMVVEHLPLAPQPASGFNLLRAHCCHCSWPLSLLPAGLQLVATDARVIPEELFFQLQKPPQHGSLLKSTAESSGPMAAGRYSLGIWPAWGFFFFNE